MAPKRGPRNRNPLAAASSDALSGFQVVQRRSPTKKLVATAPADQESSDESASSDDEHQPPPPPPPKGVVAASAEIAEKNMASHATSQVKRKAPATEPAKSPRRKKKMASRLPEGKAVAAAALAELAKSAPQNRNAADELAEKHVATPETSQLKKKKKGKAAAAAAAAELAESQPRIRNKVAAELARSPSPGREEDEYDADTEEQHFKEKSVRHWHLTQMVTTLEKAHSLSFKGAFLKVSDAKAAILESKVKNLNLREIKQLGRWNEVEMAVTNVLDKSIQRS